MIEGFSHYEMFFVLPGVVIQELVCECCDESAGWGMTFSWGFWSLGIKFMDGHDE